MQVGIEFGRDHLDLEIAEGSLVPVRRRRPLTPLADPAAAVRQALEQPVGFPALRRALTPDDHVVVVVDEHLPQLATLLTPVLEHLVSAHIDPAAVTLLCQPGSESQPWVDELPDEFADVRIEVHDPGDRRHLSYLATTRHGRRIYLNRTAVDADQLVVLGGRGYDPVLGYSGAEGMLYPILSDEETRQEMGGRLSLAVPGATPWPVRQEAVEVAWLLGAPFLVQVIEAGGDQVAHVIGGTAESGASGVQLLDACWRVEVDRPADTVVATVSGDPTRHGFADLARAAACASRVVKSRGRIVLLSQSDPVLPASVQLLRNADDPTQAVGLLKGQTTAGLAAAWQWATAAQQASIYLLSGLPEATSDELFATRLEDPHQVQRLLSGGGSTIILPDAHKTLAVPSDASKD